MGYIEIFSFSFLIFALFINLGYLLHRFTTCMKNVFSYNFFCMKMGKKNERFQCYESDINPFAFLMASVLYCCCFAFFLLSTLASFTTIATIKNMHAKIHKYTERRREEDETTHIFSSKAKETVENELEKKRDLNCS